MNDTERMDWLQKTQAIVNYIPPGYGRCGPNGENFHVGIQGADPFGELNRHYWGTSYRDVIDIAAKSEAMLQRGERAVS